MPLTVNHFRSIANFSSDRAVRLRDNGAELTTDSRNFFGRLIRSLDSGKLHRENRQTASEFLRVLNEGNAQELVSKVFRGVRRDAVFSEDGVLQDFDAQRSLSAREIHQVLSGIEAEKATRAIDQKLDRLTQEYTFGGKEFTRVLGASGHPSINPQDTWEPAQKNFFNQRLRAAVREALVSQTEASAQGELPKELIDHLAVRAFGYVDSLHASEVLGKEDELLKLSSKGEAAAHAIHEENQIASAFGSLINQENLLLKDVAFKDVEANLKHSGDKSPISRDEHRASLGILSREALKGLTPTQAVRLLGDLERRGSQGRSFLLALGLEVGQGPHVPLSADKLIANADLAEKILSYIKELGIRANDPEAAERVASLYYAGFDAVNPERELNNNELARFARDNAISATSLQQQISQVKQLTNDQQQFFKTSELLERPSTKQIAGYLPGTGHFKDFAISEGVDTSGWGAAKEAFYRQRVAETVREEQESDQSTHNDQAALRLVASKALRYVDSLTEEQAKEHLNKWDELTKLCGGLYVDLADSRDPIQLASSLTKLIDKRNALSADATFETSTGARPVDRVSVNALTFQLINRVLDQFESDDIKHIAQQVLDAHSPARAILHATNVDSIRRTAHKANAEQTVLQNNSNSADLMLKLLISELQKRAGTDGDSPRGPQAVANSPLLAEEANELIGEVSTPNIVGLDFDPQYFERAQVSPQELGQALISLNRALIKQSGFDPARIPRLEGPLIDQALNPVSAETVANIPNREVGTDHDFLQSLYDSRQPKEFEVRLSDHGASILNASIEGFANKPNKRIDAETGLSDVFIKDASRANFSFVEEDGSENTFTRDPQAIAGLKSFGRSDPERLALSTIVNQDLTGELLATVQEQIVPGAKIGLGLTGYQDLHKLERLPNGNVRCSKTFHAFVSTFVQGPAQLQAQYDPGDAKADNNTLSIQYGFELDATELARGVIKIVGHDVFSARARYLPRVNDSESSFQVFGN